MFTPSKIELFQLPSPANYYWMGKSCMVDVLIRVFWFAFHLHTTLHHTHTHLLLSAIYVLCGICVVGKCIMQTLLFIVSQSGTRLNLLSHNRHIQLETKNAIKLFDSRNSWHFSQRPFGSCSIAFIYKLGHTIQK